MQISWNKKEFLHEKSSTFTGLVPSMGAMTSRENTPVSTVLLIWPPHWRAIGSPDLLDCNTQTVTFECWASYLAHNGNMNSLLTFWARSRHALMLELSWFVIWFNQPSRYHTYKIDQQQKCTILWKQYKRHITTCMNNVNTSRSTEKHIFYIKTLCN